MLRKISCHRRTAIIMYLLTVDTELHRRTIQLYSNMSDCGLSAEMVDGQYGFST